MINSQVPFTSPSLWGFHLSLKLTDTTLTLKDTYLLILLCTLWKPNEVWKPAEPRIIFYRFCWGRVVTTVTSLIEFDKKWWLAILWKHFIFCATYWNHCGGAITSHNLATVQTGKMLLLSFFAKRKMFAVQSRNHLFTIYFIIYWNPICSCWKRWNSFHASFDKWEKFQSFSLNFSSWPLILHFPVWLSLYK